MNGGLGSAKEIVVKGIWWRAPGTAAALARWEGKKSTLSPQLGFPGRRWYPGGFISPSVLNFL